MYEKPSSAHVYRQHRCLGGGGGGAWWTTSCLGAWCLAGAAWCFAVCRAGAGALTVCPFGAGAPIVVGTLPLGGGLPLGAATAVPQSTPQTARAIINFCVALFIVVFLSSIAQAHSRAYTESGRFAGDFQTDTFKTVDGKDVVIIAIKHASLRIQYNGLEIKIDPVAQYSPETDYSKFPKADVILVTHEHFDHFDREAIAVLKKDGTQVIANPAVHTPGSEDDG